MTQTKNIELVLETIKDILKVQFVETVNGKELKYYIDGGKSYLDSKDCSELAELLSQCALHLQGSDLTVNHREELNQVQEVDQKSDNKELAARLRSEFPTEFLAKNPELTQLLIDVAKALEA